MSSKTRQSNTQQLECQVQLEALPLFSISKASTSNGQAVEGVISALRAAAAHAVRSFRQHGRDQAEAEFQDAADKIVRQHTRWSAHERAEIWSYLHHVKNQLLAYLQDPHPFGSSARDAVDWHRWILNGVATGQQLQRLSQAPQGVRDVLQYAKSAGGELVAPHVLVGDEGRLKPEVFRKRFGCDGAMAVALQTLFTTLEADAHTVDHYVREVKQRGLGVVFLELQHWAQAIRQFEVASIVLDPQTGEPADALRANRHVEYRVDPTPPPASARGRKAPLPGSPMYEELNAVDEGNNDGGEVDEEDPVGFFSTIGFHRVPSDADPEPPQSAPVEHHFLVEIDRVDRLALPKLLQRIYLELKRHPELPRVTRAIWEKVESAVYRKAHPSVRRALADIDRADTVREIARLGQPLYVQGCEWTSCERKLVFGAYKARKAALSNGASNGATPPHKWGAAERRSFWAAWSQQPVEKRTTVPMALVLVGQRALVPITV
jgi:hypothetical protein